MHIIHLKKIDSTNTYAKENIEKFEDKTVICTDCQTAGRGRFSRKWFDLATFPVILHRECLTSPPNRPTIVMKCDKD